MEPLHTEQAQCPYCGELIELVIDTTVAEQVYIEDCYVCCRPIKVFVNADDGGVSVTLMDENQA